MQPFSPMTTFYETIAGDARINTTHISLYMALLQQWNLKQGNNPVSIKRGDIMKSAKISARHTYNKYINELHKYGYIEYLPSSNSLHNSIVYLKQL